MIAAIAAHAAYQALSTLSGSARTPAAQDFLPQTAGPGRSPIGSIAADLGHLTSDVRGLFGLGGGTSGDGGATTAPSARTLAQSAAAYGAVGLRR